MVIIIHVKCAMCNDFLIQGEPEARKKDTAIIAVEPCKTCLDREETKALKAGYKDGYSEGFDTGRAERG